MNKSTRCSGRDAHLFYQTGLERLCCYLANYYTDNQYGQDAVVVRQSYQVIANQIGVSVRTVGRAVRHLKENGLCCHSGKCIRLDRRQYERIKDGISEAALVSPRALL